MRSIGREFYFASIDEYHRTVQHPDAPFAAIHNDNLCKIQFRYKCSASKPDIKGSSKKKTLQIKKLFHLEKYNDVIFNPLSIADAYARGYIRNYKVEDFLVTKEMLLVLKGKSDIIEILEEGKNPIIGIKDADGNSVNVPLEYYAKILALLSAKFCGKPVKMTLGIANEIDNALRFKDFFLAVRPIIVESLLCNGDKDHPMYSKLMNMHVDVMNTKEKLKTQEIFERIDLIPTMYEDALIIHCYVAETGWNPGETLESKNIKLWEKHQGFIDSILFIDNISSAQRIQQNCGRGCRAPHLATTCYIITAHIENWDLKENKFNKRFKFVNKVIAALEIGKAEVQDKVTFYDFLKTSDIATGTGKQKGILWANAMFTVASGSFTGVDVKWLKFIDHGTYIPAMEWLDNLCLRWIELDKQTQGYLNHGTSASNLRQIKKELHATYPETKEYHIQTIKHYLRGWGIAEHILSDSVYKAVTDHAINRVILKDKLYADIKNTTNEFLRKEINWVDGTKTRLDKLVKSTYGNNVRLKYIAKEELDYWKFNEKHWEKQQYKINKFIYDYVVDPKNIHFSNELMFKEIKKSTLSLGTGPLLLSGLVNTRTSDILKGKIFSKKMTELFVSQIKIKRSQFRSWELNNQYKKGRKNASGGGAPKGSNTGTTKKVICTHCGKQGGISLMTRYHMDNCKSKSKQDA